ncbi:MAG TPA: metallophosphoesterase [Anaerohalosphaeraceae bacterium]|nr:metallophosphoesterase [Anaerohalosphaeraceae bacterium]
MHQQVIQLFNDGAKLNTASSLRRGNVVYLPDHGKVIVTGDLHGHRRNFERIVHYANLENNPETHVIFQEIIHGGPEDDFGGCLSYQLLFEVIKYKIRFPEQVHIILGNHDTAAVCNTSVLKAGKEMNLAMKTAMRRHFKAKFEDVEAAMSDYMMSQPLAVKCANRIWLSHSLPADGFEEDFDTAIFDRPYTLDDIQRPKSVYLLTWGRRHSQKALDYLAQKFDVDLFVLGHQPQEIGWGVAGTNTLIIASEHNFGCLLVFDLAQRYTLEQLCNCLVPMASIG